MTWFLHIALPIIGFTAPSMTYNQKVEVTVPFVDQASCLKSLHMMPAVGGLTISPVPPDEIGRDGAYHVWCAVNPGASK